jgi:hypothetical protein
MWTFREYVKAGGEKELSDWFENLSEEAQAAVLVAMEYLQDVPRHLWVRPRFDLLHKMDGMGEIRLGKKDGVQTRLVGYFGPDQLTFTIVLVVTKKDKNYTPKDWKKIAKKRRKECDEDGERVNVWAP